MITTLIAQAEVTVGGQTITNPLLDSSFTSIGDVINRVLPFLYGIAGIILFFILIWGGIDMVASGGDAEKVGAGRMKITAGIIGFILLVISFLLVRILAYVFGLSNGII